PGLRDVGTRSTLSTYLTEETTEAVRTAYSRDVALRPLEEVGSFITTGGFEKPVLFLQTGLIHAWYANKA
ncbi:MAG TPA: SAM-dependent methyltransferase, partial [Verrucomicrobiales bacterium]|nr:SAM-dependent methyltransferase [Verrucomicrobiales bacterium]